MPPDFKLLQDNIYIKTIWKQKSGTPPVPHGIFNLFFVSFLDCVKSLTGGIQVTGWG